MHAATPPAGCIPVSPPPAHRPAALAAAVPADRGHDVHGSQENREGGRGRAQRARGAGGPGARRAGWGRCWRASTLRIAPCSALGRRPARAGRRPCLRRTPGAAWRARERRPAEDSAGRGHARLRAGRAPAAGGGARAGRAAAARSLALADIGACSLQLWHGGAGQPAAAMAHLRQLAMQLHGSRGLAPRTAGGRGAQRQHAACGMLSGSGRTRLEPRCASMQLPQRPQQPAAACSTVQPRSCRVRAAPAAARAGACTAALPPPAGCPGVPLLRACGSNLHQMARCCPCVQALFDLEATNAELKGDLRDL